MQQPKPKLQPSHAKVTVATPLEILWAFIGLLLTIVGTLLEASIASPSGIWGSQALKLQPLGVTYQIGAILLVGCLGGKNAGLLSQIAYLALGLTGLPVFTQGGGLDYVTEPTFGYLLGFIPGAWVCGWLAFQMPPRLEFLALSCLGGLFVVHLVGLGYLGVSTSFSQELWGPAAQTYSLNPLPGQLAVVCAVTVVAYVLRQIMFY